MSAHVLTLDMTVRPHEVLDGGATRRGVRYLEPVVDGRPLQDLVEEAAAFRGDWAGRLSPGFGSWLDEGLRMFLGRRPGDLPSGRVPLLVCPECGDAGCGAVGARVTVSDATIEWFDFAYENTYEDPIPYALGPFTFDRSEYERVLEEGTEAVTG